jgi:hypothetical protein
VPAAATASYRTSLNVDGGEAPMKSTPTMSSRAGVDGCQRSVEAERESARQVEGKQDRGLLAHRVPITDDRPVITCGALVMD